MSAVRFLLIAAGALMGLSSTAFGEAGVFLTGNQLLAVCTSGAPYDQSRCFEYLEGVADMSIKGARQAPDLYACVPPGVIAQQLRDITVQFLQTHISIRQYSGASLAAYALSLAFPCQQPY